MKNASMSRMGQGKDVVQVELVDRRTIKTDGGASPLDFPVGPVFEGLGPRMDLCTIHALCSSISSANLTYALWIQKSYNGLDWGDGAAAIMSSTSEGYTVSAAYNTRTDFGLFTRFVMRLTDTGSVEQGTFCVTVALKFFT